MIGHRIGWIVLASVASTIVGTLALVLGPFGGATENVITGAAMLAFGAGFSALAVLSVRFTDQPQRWAVMPAMFGALTGLLFLSWPGIVTNAVAAYVLPLFAFALVLWMMARARIHLRSRVRRWVLYPVFAMIALCTIGAELETIREHFDSQAYPIRGELAGAVGHQLNLVCIGSGSPAVLLFSGFGEASGMWSWISAAVSRSTRVCAFDRAGRGWSDDVPHSQDGVVLSRNLHEALEHADVHGPFVLVGHSFGGLYARVFALEYPEQVAGVVLLDATHPDMFSRISTYPSFYEAYRRLLALFPSLARLGVGRVAYYWNFDNLPVDVQAEQRALASTARVARSQRDEWTMAPIVMNQARALTSFGAIPLIVVTAGRDAMNAWIPLQNDLVKLSPLGLHRVCANATHMGVVDTQDFAGMSSDAIIQVVQLAR